MKNILFVCSRNKKRSLTAEKVYAGSSHVCVKSAGTEEGSRVKVTSGLVNWADTIFVMEKKHRARLLEKYPEIKKKELIVLHIPDDYECMDEELVETFRGILG